MKKTIKSQGEQKPSEPLPEGDYGVTLANIESKKTKKGDVMLVLHNIIEGTSRKITDNLVDLPSVEWKWEQVALAFGAAPAKEGEDIEIDTDKWIGKRATVHLKIESYTNDKGEARQTNRVDYWIVPEKKTQKGASTGAAPSHAAPAATEEEEDSDVPF